MYVCAQMYMCACVRTHVYMYVCVHVCVCVCMCVFVCMHQWAAACHTECFDPSPPFSQVHLKD